MNTKNTSIPIIDVGSINLEISSALLSSFYEAYHHLGFGYIINHGIDPALMKSVFEVSRRFHALTLKEKIKVSLDHKHHGYIAINTSTDVNSKLAEVKNQINQQAS